MTCKEIKKLLIEHRERQLPGTGYHLLTEHINRCRDCFRFQQELRLLRASLETMEPPLLPRSLDEKTRARCSSALPGTVRVKKTYPFPFQWMRVPGLIWGALLVLIGNLIGLIIYLIIRNDNPIEETVGEESENSSLACPHCGGPIAGDFAYCPSCAKSLKNLCPGCSKEIQPDWQVCPHCGSKLKK